MTDFVELDLLEGPQPAADLKDIINQLIVAINALLEGLQINAQLLAGSFVTQTEAETRNIPPTIDYLPVSGFDLAGDGGSNAFIRVADGTAYGSFQSADGQWWGFPVTERAFWQNVTDGNPTPPSVFNWIGRIFVGQATEHGTLNRFGNVEFGGWLDDTTGANYLPRDAQLAVMSSVGAVAITGISRFSDGQFTSSNNPIGGGFLVVNDADGSSGGPLYPAWALYVDVQHEPNASADNGAFSAGIEIAVKNKSALDYNQNPYRNEAGPVGIWLAGGGPLSTGGLPTNPSNAAIIILKNAETWNKGLVFMATSITGTDGLTGTGEAISLSRGHEIRWWGKDGTTPVEGGSIRSDIDTTDKDVSQIFDNDEVAWWGNNDKAMFKVLQQTGAPVNFISAINNIANAPPAFLAQGDDTNISLSLIPKGTGSVIVDTSSLLMDEIAAPVAPGANRVKIYAVDNGAGKTQLMAIFSSGAAQQIAIQP